MLSLILKWVRAQATRPKKYDKQFYGDTTEGSASDERVEGPLLANISDGRGDFTAPVLKALASVENISVSRGGSWGKFVLLRRLMLKVGRNFVV